MRDINHGTAVVDGESFQVHRYWESDNMYHGNRVYFCAVAPDGTEYHEESWPFPARSFRGNPAAARARMALRHAFDADMRSRHEALVQAQRANAEQVAREKP